MTDKLLNILAEKFPLSEIDVKDMATLKANGMTFSVSAYKAEGLGHVSVMKAKGFFGLMKMDTLIINPTELDLPLYSYDRIYAAYYVEGLLSNGGPSTDVFKKALGQDRTAELFREVLFGI